MLKKTLEDYRQGAVGAMMDEYERATLELKSIVQNIGEEDFTRIADTETEDESCRSIQTIMSHVVYAGYGYANNIREQISVNAAPRERKHIAYREIGGEIDKMLEFTVETLDGKWELSDEEMDKIIINTPWSINYTLEQMLEHAIVHILRHRRQIEKILLKFQDSENQPET